MWKTLCFKLNDEKSTNEKMWLAMSWLRLAVIDFCDLFSMFSMYLFLNLQT